MKMIRLGKLKLRKEFIVQKRHRKIVKKRFSTPESIAESVVKALEEEFPIEKSSQDSKVTPTVLDFDQKLSRDSKSQNLDFQYYPLLEHQNSIYCSHPYKDAFGLFTKHISQFKTVLECQPIKSEGSDITWEESDSIFECNPMNFVQTVMNVKQKTPKKSCLIIEEINDLGSPMPSFHHPSATSTPSYTPKSSRIRSGKLGDSASKLRNTSILDFFKVKSTNNNLETQKSGEIIGNGIGIKRKRSIETQNQDKENSFDDETVQELEMTENPAKKMLKLI
uniref:CSON005869 protein n=1 Tax=Culicoides sonorensis TaxID=179676 RepID=A0A336KAY9_CULSO